MDKSQAEAIAQAVLEPDLRAQEEIRHKRAVKAAYLARQRRVAWFVLVGSMLGASVAYIVGTRFSLGIFVGGLAGAAVGWIATRRSAA